MHLLPKGLRCLLDISHKVMSKGGGGVVLLLSLLNRCRHDYRQHQNMAMQYFFRGYL